MTVKIRMCPVGSDDCSDYVFTQDVVTIGRAADNVLVVPDPEKQVSSRHARIEKQGGDWFLTDLQSTNGTEVNGQVVAPGQATLLRERDKIVVGDFELAFETLAVPVEAEQTLVNFDPERLVDRLEEELTITYAGYLDADRGARAGALAERLRAELPSLLPEQARAVLTLLRARMTGGGGAAADEELGKKEELYRAGHEILKSLSARFVDAEPFRRPEDAGRFGQLLNQTLQAMADWLSKCLEGRREFETQFGADVTMMFSLEGNPLKNGQGPEEIARYLLDWRSGRDLTRVRADLEGAFRDLTMHQLGLLAGAQESVKAVLARLAPECIEELAATKSKGWLSVLPGGNREWDYYKQAFAELLDERTRLYEEIVSPNMRRGYLAAHEKQFLTEDDPGDAKKTP